MIRIVMATGNANKVREMRGILAGLPYEIVSMKEAGVSADIEENGTTFMENALIKARTVCELTGLPALADDSGLCVDALDGGPGIYSARWLGEDTPYTVKNAELIKRLEGVPDSGRGARFKCAAACVFPDGRELTAEGVFEGMIGYETRGQNGFGYDPVFYLPELGRYSAELSPEEKNAISHRGKAMRIMKELLSEVKDAEEQAMAEEREG